MQSKQTRTLSLAKRNYDEESLSDLKGPGFDKSAKKGYFLLGRLPCYAFIGYTIISIVIW